MDKKEKAELKNSPLPPEVFQVLSFQDYLFFGKLTEASDYSN